MCILTLMTTTTNIKAGSVVTFGFGMQRRMVKVLDVTSELLKIEFLHDGTKGVVPMFVVASTNPVVE